MGGGEVMKWDRFFPRRRSMRVLLVENDDSTRHVVAALLRKCSYVVAAVADGAKAWEVLKEKQHKFDLILSEVDMPSLSGIDFLAKVMSCDLSKNIPVIMMSSQDSVNVVFKCMIQGAVDFLVKPVRKNELQNLWQHVWRKHCTSNCISPVEGIDDNQAKSQDVSAKFVAIDHEDAESASKSKDNGCDVGDTQSSDSKSEFGTRNGGKYEELSDSCKASDKDMGTQPEANNIAQWFTMISESCPGSSASKRLSRRKKSVSFNEEIDGNSGRSKSFRSVVSTHPNQTTDLIGAVTSGHDSAALEKDASNIEKDIASGLLPLQDISPGRPSLSGFSQKGFKERRVLKPSAASAFSRYGKSICDARQTPGPSPVTLCTSPKKQTGIFLHPATTDKEEVPSFCAWNSAPSAERETDKLRNNHIVSSSSNDHGNTKACARGATFSANQSESPRGQHNGHHSSNEVNQNGMIFDPSQIELMTHFPFPVGRIPIQSLYAGYGAVLQPLLYSEASPSGSAAVQATKEVIPSFQQICLENNHPSYDPSCQQNYVTYSLESERMDVTVGREQGEPETSMHTDSDQMDQRNNSNANLFAGGGIMSGDITDYHCSFVMSTHQADESRYPTINGNGSEHGRSLREAALMKFRLKRKDRCFEKKVRYHSRKMLAEQRPRIKGQFVRQTTVQPTMTTTGEDD